MVVSTFVHKWCESGMKQMISDKLRKISSQKRKERKTKDAKGMLVLIGI
jgi:hypothetical protein